MDQNVMIAVDMLHDKADKTNDAHDHDELHAAAAVLMMMGGAFMSDKDYEYIQRWLEGLA